MALFGRGYTYYGDPGGLATWEPNEVLNSLIDDDYVEAREKNIRLLQCNIKRGFNVEVAGSALEYILHKTPPGPLLDPTEPRGLDSRFYRRIEILKRLRYSPILHEWDARNVDAILLAYRNGSLKMDKGKVTYWYGGQMRMGPQLQLPSVREHIDLIDRCRESFRAQQQQRAAVATFDSFDLSGHHGYHVRVQLIGQDKSIITPVLDDTGSSLLELLATPDYINLGFNMLYPHMLGITQLLTSNGVVERLSILIRAQVVVEDGRPLGPKIEIEASVTSAPLGPFYYSRCSGRILRRTLYTATAPTYGGPLYVSEKKNGVVKQLPAV
ncbi:hypothetical protein EMCG_08397 [[Emmonsia] crescens]|uniref:Uncharacterized protein n=1 Tax=[Emmonsia] crescens TaxID=73230 RepID=A0A0G2I5L2_9EURO|nr:hypothetical protein EMCG_08397 [Emmonsia crescens UAMH 3008]